MHKFERSLLARGAMHRFEGSVIWGAATETPQDPAPLRVGLGTGDLGPRTSAKNEELVLGSQLVIGVSQEKFGRPTISPSNA